MELGRECLDVWGYKRVDELIWVKTNQLQRLIRTGRTGHWLNHSKEHCLVGVKGNPAINRNLDCDVLVAEVGLSLGSWSGEQKCVSHSGLGWHEQTHKQSMARSTAWWASRATLPSTATWTAMSWWLRWVRLMVRAMGDLVCRS